jgi:hypothetical protein
MARVLPTSTSNAVLRYRQALAALFLGRSGSSEYSPNEFTWVVKSGLRQEHLCRAIHFGHMCLA